MICHLYGKKFLNKLKTVRSYKGNNWLSSTYICIYNSSYSFYTIGNVIIFMRLYLSIALIRFSGM